MEVCRVNFFFKAVLFGFHIRFVFGSIHPGTWRWWKLKRNGALLRTSSFHAQKLNTSSIDIISAMRINFCSSIQLVAIEKPTRWIMLKHTASSSSSPSSSSSSSSWSPSSSPWFMTFPLHPSIVLHRSTPSDNNLVSRVSRTSRTKRMRRNKTVPSGKPRSRQVDSNCF